MVCPRATITHVARSALLRSVGSVTFHREEWAGYRVVAWKEAGVLRAFVADLPADRLLTPSHEHAARGTDRADQNGPSSECLVLGKGVL